MRTIFAFLALSTMTCYADFSTAVARQLNDKRLGEEMMSVQSGGVILYIMNCEESEMISIVHFSEDFPSPIATVSVEFRGSDGPVSARPADAVEIEPAEASDERFLGISGVRFSKDGISEARAIRVKVLDRKEETLLFLEMNLKGIVGKK